MYKNRITNMYYGFYNNKRFIFVLYTLISLCILQLIAILCLKLHITQSFLLKEDLMLMVCVSFSLSFPNKIFN